VVFEEDASEFIIALTGRKRRKLVDIAYAIAEKSICGGAGLCFAGRRWKAYRPHCDGGLRDKYWVDAPVKRIVVLEIEREE
jgi:hypothetical protein